MSHGSGKTHSGNCHNPRDDQPLWEELFKIALAGVSHERPIDGLNKAVQIANLAYTEIMDQRHLQHLRNSLNVAPAGISEPDTRRDTTDDLNRSHGI